MKLKNNIAISESGFMFDAGTGESYSLNNTGKLILTLLKQGKNEQEIKKDFTDLYKVEPEIFEKNYYDFLTMLTNMNLLDDSIQE